MLYVAIKITDYDTGREVTNMVRGGCEVCEVGL